MASTTRRKRYPAKRFSGVLPGHLSIREAAEIVGLSHSQLWRYVTAGLLPARKTVFGWAIPEKDLDGFERLPAGNPAFKTRKNPSKTSHWKLKRR